MPHSRPAPPRAILLATDLGARCDRALSRALQLARQWDARLVVATVLPPAPAQQMIAGVLDAPDPLAREHARQAAEWRLRRDLGAEADGIALEVRVGEGHVGRAVLQLAAETGCGLVVTGIASDPVFELPALGSTVLWLTRHCPLPLLVVHRRVRAPYRDLAVATDFSESARHATRQALALFGPPLRLALVHALESPGSALLAGDRDALQAQARLRADEQAREFQAGLPPMAPDQVRTVIEPGDPARLLRQHAQAEDIDLAVVGTHGRGALFELLIGSIARRLVATLETDTLLVRDPRSLPEP
ncbi:universal stress protein [Stenotrophomonas sp. MYb238]|uniref:universal stress protein n=1 Tax=Stenotrophomonas sp. MYb238 TaxID=2040281 RepID=UPI001292851A|nr:universal stress protein [Stenotrophomonas sp. MYb238]MQP74391.1 universal stress protein [Stenotrophomonas sp. MYb238]